MKLVAIPKIARRWRRVAFTPKGGCPLKLERCIVHLLFPPNGSIHPQGWVPIETFGLWGILMLGGSVAFTPKGGCPLKHLVFRHLYEVTDGVAFTPKGGCPLKQVYFEVPPTPHWSW